MLIGRDVDDVLELRAGPRRALTGLLAGLSADQAAELNQAGPGRPERRTHRQAAWPIPGAAWLVTAQAA